jgi:aminoglycoside phosphotransferase (APT) family kinase protein
MNLGNPVAIGNTAKVYLHNNQIIKVFHDHFSEEDANYEASKQVLAFSSGLPVPRLVEVTVVQGNPAIIMEQIEGKTLGELMLEDNEKIEYYIDLSVTVQQEIHRVEADALKSMPSKLSSQIQAAQGLSEEQKQKLLDKLERMPSDNRLCHGDFHLFNLILSGEDVYIIDWIDASSGNICADVCRTYLLYTQHYKELAELYLSCYCSKSGLTRNEILEWEPIIAGARMAEIVPTEDPERLLQIVRQFTGC